MACGTALASVPTQSSIVSGREQRTADLFSELRRSRNRHHHQQLVEEILRVNLPFCDALAGRYVGRGVEKDDLIQVARTALLLAVRRFKPGEGRSFASFAAPTITGELKRHFRDHGWMVRPPRALQELRARVTRSRAALEQKLGREVGTRELSEHLAVDSARLRQSLASGSAYRPWSLEAPLSDDSASSLGDALSAGGDAVEALIERLDLRRALRTLSDRDRAVLRWRFADECSQSDIAQRLGVSQMQVSRILRSLLGRLRSQLHPAQPVAV